MSIQNSKKQSDYIGRGAEVITTRSCGLTVCPLSVRPDAPSYQVRDLVVSGPSNPRTTKLSDTYVIGAMAITFDDPQGAIHGLRQEIP